MSYFSFNKKSCGNLRAYAVTIFLYIMLQATQSSAQCTPAGINWDWQYKVSAITSPTRFAIGVNSMNMTWGSGISSSSIPVNSSFTGYGTSGYGNGKLLQFTTGNGTITFSFTSTVTSLKFAVYDLDNGQSLNVTAADSLSAAKIVTMTAANSGSSVTISGSGTVSATAAGPAGDLVSSATTSGVNIDISGPVKSVTLSFTKSSGSDNIWLSDINACVNGDYVSGYTTTVAPEAGQPTYVVSCDGTNNLFAIDVATGTSHKLFTDATVSALNSLAYDPYNMQFYYCDNSSSGGNKAVYRYDLRTCTRTTFIADVTAPPFNIPVSSAGVGSGAGSFNNGSLFLGIDVSSNTNEDAAAWRIDLDASGNAVSASRVFGTLGSVTSPSNQVYYNWADFVVYNGVLYNFNAGANAAAGTNLLHYDLNTQTTLANYTVSGLLQASLDYYGNIYNISSTISEYNGAGAFGTALTISGDGWSGSATDAAEYFKFPADYGDAPASYGRPFHNFKPCNSSAAIHLGSTVDYELNPVPASTGAVATGDDNANYTGSGTTDDEDGIASFPVLTAGTTGTYTISSIPVTNTSGGNAVLYGWIDFNQDGNFSASEVASATVANGAATATLSWNLSGFTPGTTIKLGNTYARFRITSVALTDAAGTTAVDERSTAGATDGEVEDYRFTISGLSISGTVSNDVNGLTDGTVNGTGIGAPGSTQLYAYLASSGTVAAKDTLAANGVYSFANAAYGGKAYTVVITSNNVAVGAVVPASAALPSGWISVGDAYGANNSAGTGNETGIPNAQIAVTTGTADITGVNFGIEELPTPAAATLASQVNPGGTSMVSIATANFTGTDPSGGTVSQLRFTGFPTNITSITIGAVNYTSGTFPAAGVTVAVGTSVSIDPVNGAVTVVIPFAVIDNAGKESASGANVNVPFTDLLISGIVYNDADGGTINGVATNSIGSNTLYANLLDGTTNLVMATVAVAANGTYSFGTGNGVKASYTFKVKVTNTAGTAGSAAPSAALTGAVNTAEGTTAAGDGIPDGLTSVSVLTVSITGVNFGIDLLPGSVNRSYTIAPPSPHSVKALITSSGLGGLAGSDPEDGSLDTGSNITIIGVTGMNGHGLYYNGTQLVAGSVISNYNPALLSVKFDGTATTAGFSYSMNDAAGKQGATPATYLINWGLPLPLHLLSFDARKQPGGVLLTWATADERDCKGFAVQHSTDGKNWATIGNVDAGKAAYQFTDYTPVQGMNYYRLAMEDLDGSVDHSPVRTVVIDDMHSISVYPNPATDKVYVEAGDFSTVHNIRIADITGSIVLAVDRLQQRELDISSLPSGAYVLYVYHDAGAIDKFKFLKK